MQTHPISPESPAFLKAQLETFRDEIAQRDALIAQLRQEYTTTLQTHEQQVQHRDAEILRLRLLVEKIRRQLYGARSERSERLDQLELMLEELECAQAQAEAVLDRAPEPVPRKRRALPETLPREEHRHEPEGVDEGKCTTCGSLVRFMGEDVSEQLEHVPAHFKVIRHVRPKYGCPCCDTVIQAPGAGRPIEKGLPGPGLLAQVLVSKYADHQPLYRQSEIYARQGVELERSTLANWVGRMGFLLAPLVEAVERYVFEAAKLHADDTVLPVLRQGKGQTQTGRLWAYVRNDRNSGSQEPVAMWLAYSDNRRAENPALHLQGYRGVVQCDAFEGYSATFEMNGIRPAFCWAHARRKFFELAESFKGQNPDNMALEALQRIGQWYAIEAAIRGKPPDERLETRQLDTVPRLLEFKAWAEQCLTRLSKKSQTAVAFLYVLKRWEGFTEFTRNGLCEIDNNWAENSVRPVALGRKNYLFAGSDEGGARAAAMYTLIGTAKANGVEPYAYLRHVIERIADHPINRVDELLPWHVAGKIGAGHG